MNILIVLPPGMPSGGNWTYSGRLQRGLEPNGICITRKALDQVEAGDYEAADIIHSYNAYITGRHIAPIAKRLGKPFVLTMTGTDVNEHLIHPESAPSMREAVEYAARIVFLTENARERLTEMFPATALKSIVVNLGIDLPPGSGKTRADFGIEEDAFVFLLVAGIRGVKRPLFAYEGLRRVHAVHPQVRFLIAGSVIDEGLFDELQRTLEDSPFASYLGEVPYDDIRDLYLAADAAMNTSSSEGLSHALLEAMSVGRPVLATNVPGNRDLIEEDVNGLLFHDDDELEVQAARLVTDGSLRDRLSAGATATIEENFSLRRELKTFFELYTSVTALKPCTAATL